MTETVHGLTKATHVGALATAQSMHIESIASAHSQLQQDKVEMWESEVNRIGMILENWDTLKTVKD